MFDLLCLPLILEVFFFPMSLSNVFFAMPVVVVVVVVVVVAAHKYLYN